MNPPSHDFFRFITPAARRMARWWIALFWLGMPSAAPAQETPELIGINAAWRATTFDDSGGSTAAGSFGNPTNAPTLLIMDNDSDPPVLLWADAGESLTRIVATFSEPLAESGTTNMGHFVVTNRLGGLAVVLSAMLSDETNIVIVTEPRNGTDYLLEVIGLSDRAIPPNAVAPNSRVPVLATQKLVAWDSEWAFADPFPGIDELDLGTAWREEEYPQVADWGSGHSAFAYASATVMPPVPVGFALSGGAPTTYFRRSFEFNASLLGATLRIRHAVQDGAVFYLNGSELSRNNMASGEVNFMTPATSAVPVAVVSDVMELPVAAMRRGNNLLAVEVHGGTDRRYFACELEAVVASTAIGPVVITQSPIDVMVDENKPATLTFVAAGAHGFQWYQDGFEIPGATNTVFARVMNAADDGRLYHVVAWNDSNSATSDVAHVTVRRDTVAPELLSAMGNGYHVVLTFSEPLDETSATDPSHYELRDFALSSFEVVAAELMDASTVRLRLLSPAKFGDVVLVREIVDRSVAANVVQTGRGLLVGFDGMLVPLRSVWKYDETGRNLGTTWREVGYDDASWSSGPALLGYESATLEEPIATEMTPGNLGGPLTAYFRTTFSSPATGARTLRVRLIVDDGAALYLNGVEVFLWEVSPNPSYLDFATRSVGDAVLEGPFEWAVETLVATENVLAAELHQVSDSSSDLVFGVELTIDPMPSEPPPEPPALNAVRQGNRLVLSWSLSEFILEQGATIHGPWTPLPTLTSPVTRPMVGPWRYFRLRQLPP